MVLGGCRSFLLLVTTKQIDFTCVGESTSIEANRLIGGHDLQAKRPVSHEVNSFFCRVSFSQVRGTNP